MAFNNVWLLFNRGKRLLQRDGVIRLIKRGFLFLIGFQYENVYVYENTFDKLRLEPEVPDATLKTITTTQELERLIVEGFNIDSHFDKEELRLRVKEGMILFCVFIGKDLVHTSFVAMNSRTNVDPVLSRLMINWQNEASIGPCNTHTKYRGLNIYPYALSQICRYLQRENKQCVKITASKSNTSSIKGIEKAKFRICGEARYLRLLHFKFCKVKPIKEMS